MFELKVRKVGKSLGVILPQEVIANLNIKEGTALYLTETPGGYEFGPYDPEFVQKLKKAEDIMNRYCDTLRVLAQ